MKKRTISLLLAVLLSLALAAPAAAANAAKVSISWLKTEGKPYAYNETFDWLTLQKEDETFYVVERKSGKRVEQVDYISEFEGKHAKVGKYVDGKIKYGYMDKSKKIVLPMEYDDILLWDGDENVLASDGLMPVCRFDADGEPKYGAVDASGKVVVPLVHDFLYRFHDGLAVVGKKTADGYFKYGFIDKSGKVVVPMEYDSINYTDGFTDGVAYVGKAFETEKQKGVKWGCVDKTGKVVVPVEDMAEGKFYDDRYISSRYDGKTWFYTVYDKSGKIIVPEGKYDGIQDFSNGLARVTKKDESGNRKYGYIDKNGKVVFPLEYDSASSKFKDGMATVGVKSADGTWKWKYIDHNGKTVLTLNDNYTYVGDFSEGLAYVCKDNLYGYIDRTGKVVVPIKYSGVDLKFNNGFASVSINGKTGAINASGTLVVPAEYNSVFITGADGRDVIEVEKLSADGTAKRGCYNKTGKLVIPVEYDVIAHSIYQPEGKAFLLTLEKGEKKGIFDSNGNVILPVEYDEIGIFGNLIYVKKDGAYGVFERP